VLSPAVDVFSFGVVAYRLLTGKQPHLEAPLHARMAGREIQPVLPAVWIGRHVSEELSRILDACLSPQPGERPSVPVLLALVRTELERWRTTSGQIATADAPAQESEDGARARWLSARRCSALLVRRRAQTDSLRSVPTEEQARLGERTLVATPRRSTLVPAAEHAAWTAAPCSTLALR
jgi:serine/threonine protein kinase